jgi:hypothetical protein
MADELYQRAEFQAGVRQEIDRSQRYCHAFTLVVFEARRGSDRLPLSQKMLEGLRTLRQTLRSTDLAYKVYEDTLAALLIETSAADARAAIHRIGSRLATATGGWNVTVLHFPEQKAAIEELPLLTAA